MSNKEARGGEVVKQHAAVTYGSHGGRGKARQVRSGQVRMGPGKAWQAMERSCTHALTIKPRMRKLKDHSNLYVNKTSDHWKITIKKHEHNPI